MSTTDAVLERSRSTSAEERYASCGALGRSRDPAALRRLVELLADDAIGESHYSPIHDEHVETSVAAAAREALQPIVDLAVRELADALPTSPAATTVVELLRSASPRHRLELPAEAHDRIVERTARADLERWTAAFAFERELARRHRDGELAGWEPVWQVWLRDHPDQRGAAIPLLVACGDPSSVGQQLVELLEDRELAYASACALRELLPALDDRWIRAICDSPWPAKLPILLPALARHGSVATAIIPTCVEILETSDIRYAGAKPKLAAEALAIFGKLAESVRPQLVARFLTVDEQAGLQGSLRFILVGLLGRDRLVAELGDIDAMPEPDWYAKQRKREIKQALGLTR